MNLFRKGKHVGNKQEITYARLQKPQCTSLLKELQARSFLYNREVSLEFCHRSMLQVCYRPRFIPIHISYVYGMHHYYASFVLYPQNTAYSI